MDALEKGGFENLKKSADRFINFFDSKICSMVCVRLTLTEVWKGITRKLGSYAYS